MNTIDYTFVVDLARPLKTNTLLVMQHDANSRVVHFLLMNDGKRFDCTDVTGVIVTAVTGGGSTIVSSDVEIVQDDDENNTNELVFTLPSDLTATAGRSTLVITLYGENTQISSFEFYVNTRNELYNVGSYSDTDDLSGFRDLLTRALTAVARVENMQSSTEFPNSMSMLSLQCYHCVPKTLFRWLVKPFRTGFPPALRYTLFLGARSFIIQNLIRFPQFDCSVPAEN